MIQPPSKCRWPRFCLAHFFDRSGKIDQIPVVIRVFAAFSPIALDFIFHLDRHLLVSIESADNTPLQRV